MREPYKVMAMHDMCGYGRSSLTAAIPVLAVLNCQACPLPTALLSSHFGFDNPSVLNLSAELKKFLPQWIEQKFAFDAFYSGYLASPDQVAIALDYIGAFAPKLVFVDPVLGDDGVLYPGFDQDQVEAMRGLVSKAHAVSPNVTEALALLGRPLSTRLESDEAKTLLKELAAMGPDYICITGAPDKDDLRINVFGYEKPKNRYYKVSTPRFDRSAKSLHGTGDAFASVLVGFLLQGLEYERALLRAMSYLYKTVELAIQYHTEICLEPAFASLIAGNESATLEIT